MSRHERNKELDEIIGMVQAYGAECVAHNEGPEDLSHQIAMSEHRILCSIEDVMNDARRETIRAETVLSGFDSYLAGFDEPPAPDRIWRDAIKWVAMCWVIKCKA